MYPYPYANNGGGGYRRSSSDNLPGLREIFDSRVLTPGPPRISATPQPVMPGSVFLQHAQGYPQPARPAPQAYAPPPGYPPHQQYQPQRFATPAPPPAPAPRPSQFAVLAPSGQTLAAADTYHDMLSAARTARRDGAPADDGRACPYCGKVCDRPSTLKTHINSHTGERPHTCYVPGCGRQFTVLSNMYRHAKTCTAQQQQQGPSSGYGQQPPPRR